MPEKEKQIVEQMSHKFEKLDKQSKAIVNATMGALIARQELEKIEGANENEDS